MPLSNQMSQAQRANALNHPAPHHPLNNGLLLNQANAINNLPSHPQHLQSNGRLDALYDSRLDDRFVPDGMVPGLRTAPPPRSRDIYQELPDEALQFHLQRLQQQQRGPDPFNGPNPSMYGPQNGRNIGLPLHQAQFRGGPSPGIGPHAQMSGLQPQRLPPGLANLGGRPPHDPAQILGLPGHPNNPLHANLHPNAPPAPQQSFNNFVANSNNFNNPQLRGPIPNLHQLQNAGPHPSLGPIGLGNGLELRSQNPNQVLGVGGPGLPGPRGNGLFNPQQNANHLQGPLLGTRQQQAHLPPHVSPHLMPHFQQGLNGPNSGHTSELIALLMAGTQRE